MKKLEIISDVWSIRHKASLVPYLIAFVSLEEEVFVLMRRKDIYSAVKTLEGDYYIRESNTEAFRRLNEYYLWNVKITEKEIAQFKKIDNTPFEWSDDEYNGWKMITEMVHNTYQDQHQYHQEIPTLQSEVHSEKNQDQLSLLP
jgi:hypothetical protein